MYGFTQGKLDPERPTLPETLSQNGYKTGGFTTNLVCGKAGGFDRGFDTFEDMKPNLKSNNLNKRSLVRKVLDKLKNSRLVKVLAPSKPLYPSTNADELIKRGIGWLEEEKGQPCFLWLHFMDLHWPYASSHRELDFLELNRMTRDRQEWKKVKSSKGTYFPGNKIADRWRKLYAEETEALDASLGVFFSYLKGRNDWGDTALCITNDHGEELFEHGTWAHSWNQLYSEGTQTPLILKLPCQSKPMTHHSLVSHLDISPTLLEIAGTLIPEKMLGKSLFSKQAGPCYSEMLGHSNSYRYRLAIRHNGYLYIYDADTDSCLLFSLNNDPTSSHNIYSLDCEISRQFDKLRLAHVSKGAIALLKGLVVLGEDEISHNLEEDPLVIERLRALGYID